MLIHQRGPIAWEQLRAQTLLPEEVLERSLQLLAAAGRITIDEQPDGPVYRCDAYEIAFGEPRGWEAAVFDHYQAAVGTIVTKLRDARLVADRADMVGGSTYVFDLWDAHPARALVTSLLRRACELAADARAIVQAVSPPPDAELARVTFYVGQNITGGTITGKEQE